MMLTRKDALVEDSDVEVVVVCDVDVAAVVVEHADVEDMVGRDADVQGWSSKMMVQRMSLPMKLM